MADNDKEKKGSNDKQEKEISLTGKGNIANRKRKYS